MGGVEKSRGNRRDASPELRRAHLASAAGASAAGAAAGAGGAALYPFVVSPMGRPEMAE